VCEVEEVGGEPDLIAELCVAVVKSKQASFEFEGLSFMNVFL
jgi:hypothetical protein